MSQKSSSEAEKDTGDLDYHPLGNTPTSRKSAGSKTDENSKKRVITLLPNENRCLLTQLESKANQVAHVVDGATKPSVLSALEGAWGIPSGKLNVDSTKNLMLLNPSLHHLFDQKLWILLPERDMINRYVDINDVALMGKQFPKDIEGNGVVFKYRLVAHPKLEKELILRKNNPPSTLQADNITRNGAYTVHTFPFLSLGTIYSHIQTRFVISNAGYKLAHQQGIAQYQIHAVNALKKAGLEPSDAVDLAADIQKTLLVYQQWMSFRPSTRVPANQSTPATSEQGSASGSKRTHSTSSQGSGGSRLKKPRKGAPTPTGPSTSPSHQSAREGNSMLTRDALQQQQMENGGSEAGETHSQKGRSIYDWIEGCTEVGDEESAGAGSDISTLWGDEHEGKADGRVSVDSTNLIAELEAATSVLII